MLRKLSVINPHADRGFELWKCVCGLKRPRLRKIPLLRTVLGQIKIME